MPNATVMAQAVAGRRGTESGVTEGKPRTSPLFLGSAIEAKSGRWRSSLATHHCPMEYGRQRINQFDAGWPLFDM